MEPLPCCLLVLFLPLGMIDLYPLELALESLIVPICITRAFRDEKSAFLETLKRIAKDFNILIFFGAKVNFTDTGGVIKCIIPNTIHPLMNEDRLQMHTSLKGSRNYTSYALWHNVCLLILYCWELKEHLSVFVIEDAIYCNIIWIV